MKKNLWGIIGIVAVVAALFLFGGGMMMGGWGLRNGYGMMGGYGGPGGMMGGYGMTLAPGASAGVGNWGFSPLGWLGMGLGMLLMWGLPIALIVLAGFGVVSLVQRNSKSNQTPAAQTACPNCAKNVQPDWQNCPYCGTSLK